jgi:hypothetical protein
MLKISNCLQNVKVVRNTPFRLYSIYYMQRHQSFETKVCLNNIQEFSLYLKENTTYHYKNQLVIAV